MTILRDVSTSTKDFRSVLKEITFYLGYEATKELKLQTKNIKTPLTPYEGSKLAESISIIPILRAGLGMSEPMSELIPTAAIHHIGMYRCKTSMLPIQYYNRLPRDKVSDVAFIMEPCIATSNTIHAVINILKRWGCKKIIVISAIGAKSGVDRVLEEHPDVSIYIGAVDEKLSDSGMIIPGIGDAGDRQFGTPNDDVPNFLPIDTLSPSKSDNKRKR
jgi:uracil phosphoribosyltransferase